MSNAQIHITLKPALLDTQGATVLKALHQLGHAAVCDVRIGKLIEVQFDDTLPPAQQQSQLETMCRQLLANPVIEDFSIVFQDNGTLSPRNTTVITTTTTQNAALPNTMFPVFNEAPLGSEATAIGEPFAVSYETYNAMTAEEKLDLQGRAWNLHGAGITNELDARRAAWLVRIGDTTAGSGDSLDSFPTDAQLAALGTQHDLVPFVFTRPPQ